MEKINYVYRTMTHYRLTPEKNVKVRVARIKLTPATKMYEPPEESPQVVRMEKPKLDFSERLLELEEKLDEALCERDAVTIRLSPRVASALKRDGYTVTRLRGRICRITFE